MFINTVHKNPPEIPTIVVKEKQFLRLWFEAHRHIPKTERLSLGQKISEKILIILELTLKATRSTAQSKQDLLYEISLELDVLKLLLQISWENKSIAPNKYLQISELAQELGQMLGGWIKSTQNKTSIG